MIEIVFAGSGLDGFDKEEVVRIAEFVAESEIGEEAFIARICRVDVEDTPDDEMWAASEPIEFLWDTVRSQLH